MAHPVVVMLACVDENMRYLLRVTGCSPPGRHRSDGVAGCRLGIVLFNCIYEGGDLHKIGAGAYEGYDFHLCVLAILCLTANSVHTGR